MTHPGLEESDLYDDPPPPPSKTPIVDAAWAAGERQAEKELAEEKKARTLSTAMDIVSYRLILLLSVLVAGGLFGVATWNPDPWRLAAAAAFSVIVVAPLTFFYARR